jgi:M6 family metalloprotease-like protein
MSAATRTRTRDAAWTCAALVVLLAVARPAGAQDIELRARPGVQLPAGYYDMLRQKPGLFEIDRGWSARTTLFPRTSAAALEGTLRLVVLQALFADSPEPWMTRDDIQRVLFDGPTPHGTLTDFYREVSRGKLTVTGSVTPWVRTQLTRAETVGEAYGLGPTSKVGTWVVQALREADADIDFAQYDNDGPDGIPNSGDDDGYVDALAVQFFEIAAACGGDGIWPFRSRISGWLGEPYVSDDIGANGQRVRVDSFIVQSTRDCDGDRMQNAGVIAHELGHVFGLPDLYHQADGLLPAQRRWVVGCWTLMAAGAWGCGDGASWPLSVTPPHMGAWEKWILGWVQEEIVGSVRDREYVLPPVQTSGRILRVTLGANEFLQIEYRPQIGFDRDLPAGGVLIYHIDYTRPGFFYPPPGGPRLYTVALREADGDSALIRTALEGGNRGVAGDAWAVNGEAAFSAITQPALRRNNGMLTGVTIHSMVIEDGVARLRISTAAQPALVQGQQAPAPVALGAWERELRAAGGALPYSWTVQGLPAGLSWEPAGPDRLRLHGTPLQHGTFALAVRITDALGVSGNQSLNLTIAAAPLGLERMLQPLLRTAAAQLTADEQTYLDRAGNDNGRYDIGDLRSALLASAAGG